MADVIAYKFMNGRRQVRQFSEIAWNALGRNKQGWTQDSGDVDLKTEVPVVEKKNHAAKAAVEGNKPAVEPVADDGVPGIEPVEFEATTGAEPETEVKPEAAKAKAKPKTKKPQTKRKQ